MRTMEMTGTQRKRFENVTDRVIKKIEGTFGKTGEDTSDTGVEDSQTYDADVERHYSVVSRGVRFYFSFYAERV